MKLDVSHSVKLVISDLDRIDPVTVFLEDLGRRNVPIEGNPDYWTGQGKITINCWDKSWNAYWGGMGQQTLAQFVVACHTEYVLNCLDRGIESRKFSGDALILLAKRCILERRRGRKLPGFETQIDWELGYLDHSDAYRLWDKLDLLRGVEHPSDIWHYGEILRELFGEEYHYPIQEHALETNHEYLYLERVVLATQQGIALYLEQQHETGSSRRHPDPTGPADAACPPSPQTGGSGL